MNIESQKTSPVMNIPEKKLFDVCLELNKLTFPVSRRDDALFYIRPDMCIKQRDFGAIQSEFGRAYGFKKNGEIENKVVTNSLVDELIYIPTEADLFKETHGTVNQLTETLTSGWFAYTTVRIESESPEFIKGNGATPWFALADAWLQVQKLKTANDLTAKDISNEN